MPRSARRTRTTSATWGPNAAAQEFIDPAILSNPNLNPDAGVYADLAELVTLEGADLDKYTQRWLELTA